MIKYTVLDRVTLNKAAFQMTDEQLLVTTSTDTILAEPVLRDDINISNYFKLFISDGQIGWEATSTHVANLVVLTDTVTGDPWKLGISDGQLIWTKTVYFNTFSIFQSLISEEIFLESLLSEQIILESEMVAK